MIIWLISLLIFWSAANLNVMLQWDKDQPFTHGVYTLENEELTAHKSSMPGTPSPCRSVCPHNTPQWADRALPQRCTVARHDLRSAHQEQAGRQRLVLLGDSNRPNLRQSGAPHRHRRGAQIAPLQRTPHRTHGRTRQRRTRRTRTPHTVLTVLHGTRSVSRRWTVRSGGATAGAASGWPSASACARPWTATSATSPPSARAPPSSSPCASRSSPRRRASTTTASGRPSTPRVRFPSHARRQASRRRTRPRR